MDLTGKVVRLRAPHRDDAEQMVRILSKPHMAANLVSSDRKPYSLEDALGFIDEVRENAIHWAIEDRSCGELVGMVGLVDIKHSARHCWLDIWIGTPTGWSNGLGQEACTLTTRFAFHHLGMEKVCLYTYEYDRTGCVILEQAGYQLEGVLPRDQLVDGRLVTRCVMSVFSNHPLYGH